LIAAIMISRVAPAARLQCLCDAEKQSQ